jgi:hypothetical protein
MYDCMQILLSVRAFVVQQSAMSNLSNCGRPVAVPFSFVVNFAFNKFHLRKASQSEVETQRLFRSLLLFSFADPGPLYCD